MISTDALARFGLRQCGISVSDWRLQWSLRLANVVSWVANAVLFLHYSRRNGKALDLPKLFEKVDPPDSAAIRGLPVPSKRGLRSAKSPDRYCESFRGAEDRYPAP